MNGLILYRSHYGNTKLVAETLAEAAVAAGHRATVQDARRRIPSLAGVDFVMVGSPTRIARPSWSATGALRKLRSRAAATTQVAVFDTYGPVPIRQEELEDAKKWIYPGAAGILQEKAKALGLKVYPTTLRCQVTGMKGPLAEHEQERASSFAKDFLGSISR